MKKLFRERKSKGDSEFTDYQREIQQTDNVILCVAKAEEFVRQLGRSLVDSPEDSAEPHPSEDDLGSDETHDYQWQG